MLLSLREVEIMTLVSVLYCTMLHKLFCDVVCARLRVYFASQDGYRFGHKCC